MNEAELRLILDEAAWRASRPKQEPPANCEMSWRALHTQHKRRIQQGIAHYEKYVRDLVKAFRASNPTPEAE